MILNGFDPNSCSFFLRFKSLFVTFHSKISDDAFKCTSFIVSFRATPDSMIEYGNILLFVQYRSSYFVLVQKYAQCSSQLDSFLEIPTQVKSKLHELFPLVILSDEFALISTTCLQHKCVLVPFKDQFCISEFRNDFEHD